MDGTRDELRIRTERLVLRDLRENDFDAVHAYGSDPEVVEFLPWGPNTEQDTRDFLERTMEGALAEPRLDYVLGVVPSGTDRVVGSIGLHLRERDPGQAMLGYAYGRPAWGRGYATEAAREMLVLGFDVLGLRRIWASCDPNNQASAAVLTKIGMVREGLLREETVIRGRVVDSLVFAILEREWRALTAKDEEKRSDG